MADEMEHDVEETGSPELEVKAEPPIQCFVMEDHQTNSFQNVETQNPLSTNPDAGTMTLWTTKATTCLINQYKKYRSMVGQTTQIRSQRDMFEMISVEMQNHGLFYTPQKCENKWRVLERKYKNLVFREKLRKPGRMRHYGHWEHKLALDEIFNDRRRHYYLDDDESPTNNNRVVPQTSGSTDTTENSTGQTNGQQESQNSSSSNDATTASTQETPKQTEPLTEVLEKLFNDMKQTFETAEKNKERRHKEEMALRQSEVEIQKKLLKVKEQKLELRKNQLLAAAQHIHLNM